MVRKTRQGEEYLGALWQGICGEVLRELQALEREKSIPAALKAWHQAEVTAWRNLQRIGSAMIDLHYRMASTVEEIDCVVQVDAEDIEACRRALDCYVTFKATIERTGIKEKLYPEVPFEFFAEDLKPPVGDLFAQLP